MYPLDVTMPQAGCCVAGGLEFGAGSILGSFFFLGSVSVRVHQPAPGVKLVRVPPIQTLPWRSRFPCHRMCCASDTLLCFALSVFRSADMIGNNAHVSFLPPEKREKGEECVYLVSDKKRAEHCHFMSDGL